MEKNHDGQGKVSLNAPDRPAAGRWEAVPAAPLPNPDHSWRWWIIVWAGTLLVLAGLMTADARFRAVHQLQWAGRWMHRLDLSAAALWPAGTAQRHPELLHPAVAPDMILTWPRAVQPAAPEADQGAGRAQRP